MKPIRFALTLAVVAALPGAAVLARQTMQSAPVTDADNIGKTGTGTRTTSTVDATVPASASSLTLQAKSSALAGPGAMTVTATMAAQLDAVEESTQSYTVPLSSSDPACTVPESLTLQWTSSAGALGEFQVECAAVPSNRTVTITGGAASTSFTLRR